MVSYAFVFLCSLLHAEPRLLCGFVERQRERCFVGRCDIDARLCGISGHNVHSIHNRAHVILFKCSQGLDIHELDVHNVVYLSIEHDQYQ